MGKIIIPPDPTRWHDESYRAEYRDKLEKDATKIEGFIAVGFILVVVMCMLVIIKIVLR